MPKTINRRGGQLVTMRPEVMQAVRSALPEIAEDHAKRLLDCAKARIENNVGHEGGALGSGVVEADLAASGYIATKARSGYDEAKGNASFGRDARRGLWADPVEVEQPPNTAVAKVAFALERALLMHEGYYDAHAGKYMHGTPFLEDCVNDEAQSRFVIDVGDMLQSLESIHVPSEAQQQEAYQRSQLAGARRSEPLVKRYGEMVHKGLWQQFVGSVEPSAFRLQSGFVKGVSGRKSVQYPAGRPIRSRETPAERNQRIHEMFREWIANVGEHGGY